MNVTTRDFNGAVLSEFHMIVQLVSCFRRVVSKAVLGEFFQQPEDGLGFCNRRLRSFPVVSFLRIPDPSRCHERVPWLYRVFLKSNKHPDYLSQALFPGFWRE